MPTVLKDIKPSNCPESVCGIFNTPIQNTISLLMILAGAGGIIAFIYELYMYWWGEKNTMNKNSHLTQAFMNLFLGAAVAGGLILILFVAFPDYASTFFHISK